jgi:competence protein ComEC
MLAAILSFFVPLFVKVTFAVLIGLIVVCLLVTVIVKRRNMSDRFRTNALTFGLCMALALISLTCSFGYFEMGGRKAEAAVGEQLTVRCEILEEEVSASAFSLYTVRVISLQGAPAFFRAALECSYTAVFHVGDVIEIQALAQSPETYYERDELTFAIADGIRLCLMSAEDDAAMVVDHRARPLRTSFAHLRDNLSSRLLSLLGKRTGGLVTALFLGNRDHLDSSVSMYFRRAGISHLLALSGMHISLLLGMLMAVMHDAKWSHRWRILLLSALALCYLALTGFSISATRAVVMVLIVFLSQLVGARHDPLTSLCVVGASMLLISPSTVADGGFWMSWCSVFGLVTVMPICSAWFDTKQFSRKIRILIEGVLASVIAVVSVSFLSWVFVGEIAPIGILVTVMMTPLLTMVLTLSPITLLLDILPGFSAAVTASLLRFFADFMIEASDAIAHLPAVSISLRAPYVGVILAMMVLTLLAMLIGNLRHKLMLLMPPFLAVILIVGGMHVSDRQLFGDRIQMAYTVRTSGSALVVTDRRETVVIDTSSGSYAMMKDAEVAALEQGATEIRALVLTHYHRAYTYSIERLAKRRLIRAVYLPFPKTESEYAILSAMKDRLDPLGTDLFCYEDREQLPLLDCAVFSRVNASYLDRSTQPIVTYILQTPSEVLTFSTPSVQESDYISTFRWISERTNILILGKDGPKCKTVLEFSPASLRLMLTDHSDMLVHLDLSPNSDLYRVNHMTDISCYFFDMQK